MQYITVQQPHHAFTRSNTPGIQCASPPTQTRGQELPHGIGRDLWAEARFQEHLTLHQIGYVRRRLFGFALLLLASFVYSQTRLLIAAESAGSSGAAGAAVSSVSGHGGGSSSSLVSGGLAAAAQGDVQHEVAAADVRAPTPSAAATFATPVAPAPRSGAATNMSSMYGRRPWTAATPQGSPAHVPGRYTGEKLSRKIRPSLHIHSGRFAWSGFSVKCE